MVLAVAFVLTVALALAGLVALTVALAVALTVALALAGFVAFVALAVVLADLTAVLLLDTLTWTADVLVAFVALVALALTDLFACSVVFEIFAFFYFVHSSAVFSSWASNMVDWAAYSSELIWIFFNDPGLVT